MPVGSLEAVGFKVERYTPNLVAVTFFPKVCTSLPGP
jgi:hypothetical protein